MKVKYILKKVKLIHSVDSFHLAEKISQLSVGKEIITDFLLQVNTSREESKFGFDENQLMDELNKISQLKNVRVKGLMTMAPYFSDPEQDRPFFKLTKKLFDQISALNISNTEMDILSMGMSHSYMIAIEEGANMVRIGSKIFGEKP